MNYLHYFNSLNRWFRVSIAVGSLAIISQLYSHIIKVPLVVWIMRLGIPLLTIYTIVYLGRLGRFSFLRWTFRPFPLPPPDPITYCGRYDVDEIKRSAPWVPVVVSFNYLLIFLWVSAFSIIFFDPNTTSGLQYLFYLFVFIACIVTFLLLTNLFRRHMDPSLYTMCCNLITLFICGIATSSMNNYTHYLHRKGEPLYDIGFAAIPEIKLKYAETSDIILVSYIMICVLRSLLLHPSVRNKMWADFGRISSIMILSKGFMGWWTLLPGPAPHCRLGTPNYAPSTIKDIFVSQGTMFGHALNCGDLIFSGHTGFLLIVMLLSEELWRASKQGIRWGWRVFTAVVFLLFSLFCLAARKHYSVDIVSAMWIATLIYCTFRHSWTPVHLTFPVARTVVIRASISADVTKADTIIVSEEKIKPHFLRFSNDSDSNESFAS